MFFVMRGPAVEPETAAVTPPAEATQSAPTPAAAIEEKSIAVLPFVNMSADPEQEYFSDGISEEILNGLAKVKALRVAGRTSSFYFKGKDVQLPEIGDSLNVSYVLEGSVRKAGERLRITAQLIKVDDGFHLWSESYDRELTDIFAVQDEIAKAVVDALKIELGVEAGSTLVDIGTSSREAYDWYLRGKDALVAGTAAGFQRGVDYFNRAIEIDSDYADAYAYLAYAHLLQHPFTPYDQLAPAIRQAYTKALALEPSNSEALCVRGYDTVYSEWDWPAAGKAFGAATRDEKINDVCLGTYIDMYLLGLGQYDEGIALLRVALRADPLNLWITQLQGAYLGWYGRESEGEIEQGINDLGNVLDAVPDHVLALVNLVITFLNTGQLDKAESALARLEGSQAPHAYQYAVWLRVQLEVLRGNVDKAQSVFDKARRVAKDGVNKSPGLWLNLGLAAVSLNDLDEAVALFNRGFDEKAMGVIFVRSFVTSLRPYTQGHGPALMAHPDFQAFLAKMNLDDASIASLEAAEAGE